MSRPKPNGAWVKTLEAALAPLPLAATPKWPDGEPYDTVINQPGIHALIFAPRGADHQTPHPRDETYVAVRGHATLEIDGVPKPMKAGDLAWVPRDVPHRFIHVSADFATWVIFTG